MQERVPTILISDGWETDENNALAEVVVPSTVTTYNAPNKVTFLGDTLNWMPSTAASLQEFVAPNITSLSGAPFSSFTNLTTVTFDNLITLSKSGNGIFYGCTKLKNVNMPKLRTILHSSNASNTGIFYNCSSLESVYFPKLQNLSCSTGVSGSYNAYLFAGTGSLTSFDAPKLEIITNVGNSTGAIFSSCTSLSTLNLPQLKMLQCSGAGYIFASCNALTQVEFPSLQNTISNSTNNGVFRNCTGLQNVTLGSVGNPVISLGTYTFNGCTQSNLTITVYTLNGASLSGSPWGATNATIVYETA